MRRPLRSIQSFLSVKCIPGGHFYNFFRSGRFAFIFLLLLFLGQSARVQATHAAGGYLTTKYNSDGTTTITVTIYLDCAGEAAPGFMEVDINSAICLGNTQLQEFIAKIDPGTEIGSPCPGNATTCQGGSSPGYKKYVYSYKRTFNANCQDIILSYRPQYSTTNQRLARNAALTTLSAPNSDYLYTETFLNNKNFPTIGTVTFTKDPILFVCAGQTTTYNIGAVKDPAVDSLVYELVDAKSNDHWPSPLTVSYINPLSGINPLFPGTGAVSINRSTGDITINTSVTQIGIIDVRVKQYKNGSLVNSVIIENQVIVQPCTNSNPTATGINGTSVFTDTVCPGSTINFNVNSNDPDVSQVVTMTWDNGIPSPATFTTSGSPHPTGTFNWVTKSSDARPQPYTFTVTVKDNNCPSNALQTYTYSIYVLGTALTVSPSAPSICSGSSVSLTAGGGSSYAWSPPTGLSSTSGGTVSASPSATTTYTVTSTGGNGGCSASATVVVSVTPLSAIAGPDTTVCFGSFVQLNASGGTNYVWTPVTNLDNPNIANPVAILLAKTTYTVNISSGSCSVIATATIDVYPELPTPTILKSADTLYFNTDPRYTSYQWYFNSSPIPGATNTFYVASLSGNYNVAVYDENGCSISVGINIVLGLSDVFGDASVTIYPNPVTDKLVIHAAFVASGELVKVAILNLLGEIIWDDRIEGKDQTSINIDHLSPGIYFVKLTHRNGTQTARFIKE